MVPRRSHSVYTQLHARGSHAYPGRHGDSACARVRGFPHGEPPPHLLFLILANTTPKSFLSVSPHPLSTPKLQAFSAIRKYPLVAAWFSNISSGREDPLMEPCQAPEA